MGSVEINGLGRFKKPVYFCHFRQRNVLVFISKRLLSKSKIGFISNRLFTKRKIGLISKGLLAISKIGFIFAKRKIWVQDFFSDVSVYKVYVNLTVKPKPSMGERIAR